MAHSPEVQAKIDDITQQFASMLGRVNVPFTEEQQHRYCAELKSTLEHLGFVDVKVLGVKDDRINVSVTVMPDPEVELRIVL